MTAGNFDRALAFVLVHEGGKSDDPEDPGGRTNFGITHFDYDAYRRSKGLPLRDVYDMDKAERDDIYRSRYWDAVCGDTLPSGVDYVVFDGAVNSGIAQSVKWLQRALGNVVIDGQLGPTTLAAVAQYSDGRVLVRAMCESRREFLRQLRIFARFGRGWLRRVSDVESTALAWAAGASLPVIVALSSPQAKAPRSSATGPPTTVPGDVVTSGSAVVLAAALAAHGHTIAVSPTAPIAQPQPIVCPCPASVPTAPPPQATTPPPPATPPAATTPSPPATTTPPAVIAKTGTITPPPGTAGRAPLNNAPPPKAVQPATHPPPPATTAAAPAPAARAAATLKQANPVIVVSNGEFLGIMGIVAALLAAGISMSLSARRARTRRADALGDNPHAKTKLKLAEPAKAVPSPERANEETRLLQFAENRYARWLSAAWIVLTIVINVIALAKLLQGFDLAHEHWHGPFVWMGNLYDAYAGRAFTSIRLAVSRQFGFTLPSWLMHAVVLYVSSASAFVVANTGLLRRKNSAEAFLGAVVHGGWLLALPAFVMDAIRYRVVARFARQNTALFFAYLLSFSAIYVAARFVNDDVLASIAEPRAHTTVTVPPKSGGVAPAMAVQADGRIRRPARPD